MVWRQAQVREEACRDRPCRWCPSSWRPQRGCSFGWKVGIGSSRRPASISDGRGAEVVLWDGGRSRGVVLPEGQKPAAVASEPEGRRWRWPSRVRRCTYRGLLAGGRNEGARAPTTRTSPAGRSASSSEAPAFVCQTGLRLSGHCGPGWRWTAGTRWGCGGWWAVDRWRCRGVEPAGGAEEPGPSLCLKGGSVRAFCLGRRMGVCLHPGRRPQGEGRSAVWPGGRCRVRPLGWMKRGAGIRVGAGRVIPMDQGDRRHTLGCQAAGEGRPALCWEGSG